MPHLKIMKTDVGISHKIPGDFLTKIACYILLLKDESQTPFRDFNLASFAGAFSSSQPGVQLHVLTEDFCGFLPPVYVIRYTALN